MSSFPFQLGYKVAMQTGATMSMQGPASPTSALRSSAPAPLPPPPTPSSTGQMPIPKPAPVSPMSAPKPAAMPAPKSPTQMAKISALQRKAAASKQELEAAIERGRRNIIPSILPSFATPAENLMASPGWSAALHGLVGGAAGAAGGGLIGSQLGDNAGLGAAVGGLGLGGLTALIGYLERNRENGNIEEVMRRTKGKATYGDYVSSPMTAGLNQKSIADSAGLAAHALLTQPFRTRYDGT